jgi:hypothetical protein
MCNDETKVWVKQDPPNLNDLQVVGADPLDALPYPARISIAIQWCAMMKQKAG